MEAKELRMILGIVLISLVSLLVILPVLNLIQPSTLHPVALFNFEFQDETLQAPMVSELGMPVPSLMIYVHIQAKVNNTLEVLLSGYQLVINPPYYESFHIALNVIARDAIEFKATGDTRIDYFRLTCFTINPLGLILCTMVMTLGVSLIKEKKKTVTAIDVNCGNWGRVNSKIYFINALNDKRALGLGFYYKEHSPSYYSIHITTSPDLPSSLEGRKGVITFKQFTIPEQPPPLSGALIENWPAYEKMRKIYGILKRRVRKEEYKQPKTPAGRRAEDVHRVLSNPIVDASLRQFILRLPRTGRVLFINSAIETGTGPAVFPKVAAFLLSHVSRELTGAILVSEPERLNSWRFKENAIFFIRHSRDILNNLDFVLLIEQRSMYMREIDRLVGWLKAIIATATVGAVYGDPGNLRSIAGWCRVMVPVELKISLIAGKVTVEPRWIPMVTLRNISFREKPVFLISTLPPERISETQEALLKAIRNTFSPSYIEACFLLAPLPSPIAFLLVPLSREELERCALGMAIKAAGFRIEEYFEGSDMTILKGDEEIEGILYEKQ